MINLPLPDLTLCLPPFLKQTRNAKTPFAKSSRASSRVSPAERMPPIKAARKQRTSARSIGLLSLRDKFEQLKGFSCAVAAAQKENLHRFVPSREISVLPSGYCESQYRLTQHATHESGTFWRAHPTKSDPKSMRVMPLCLWGV